MVGSNKILTVSYGTYSVTAEGFDDPLGVVKETTRFIRGVVTEDPLFGAEPPQIGSELVEEYIQSRFAVPSDARLSLNAPAASTGALAAALAAGPARTVSAAPATTLPAAALAAATLAADALPDDDTIETAARAFADQADLQAHLDADAFVEMPDMTGHAELAPEPEFEHAPAPPPAEPESIASRLERIRSVVSGQTDANPEPPAETGLATGDSTLDALLGTMLGHAASIDAAPAGPAPALAGDAGDNGGEEDPLESLFAAAAEEEAESFDWEDEDADDIAAHSLRDNRDDMTAARTAGEDWDDESGDDKSGDEDVLAATTAEDDWDDADEVEVEAAAKADSDDWDDEDEDEDRVAAEAEADVRDDEDYRDEDEADARAGSTAKADKDDWDALAEAWDEDEEPRQAAAPPQPPVAPAQPVSPLRARVIKVKRAIFEKAVSSGQLEAVEDEDDALPAPGKSPGKAPSAAAARAAVASSLSDEEEDELARELAAVKAELAKDLGDWDADEDDTAEVRPTPAAAQGWDEDEDDEDDWDEDRPAERAIASEDWDDEDDEDDLEPAAAAPLRLEHPVKRPAQAPTQAPNQAPTQAQTPAWETDFDALDARAEAHRRDSVGAYEDDGEDEDGSLDSQLDGVRKAVKMASPARALLTEQKVEDFDASRILDQTNEELEEPEGNRRRSAIAHLRAAVAATRADRLLGRKPDTQEQSEPYREDLATVVRPRRPQGGPARSERPAETQRPAPLKLVAEQRIPDATPAEPVRPRRIRSADLDSPAEDMRPRAGEDGFAAYAERVGARDLPELLEAAAAYMSFVEGLDQFSRPQLMSTMRQAEARESSREDRLRSFGQLLREGKIEKTSGGRFTASDRISFKPRKAG